MLYLPLYINKELIKMHYNKSAKDSKEDRKILYDYYKKLGTGRKVAVLMHLLLNGIVLIHLIYYINLNDTKHGLACIKVMIMFLFPWLIELILKIKLPDVIIIVVLLFIFSAVILGEINSFYMRYPIWDVMLHTISGFVSTVCGYMIFIKKISRSSHTTGSEYFYILIAAVSLSMTIAVFWEFYEFGMDQIMFRDMQKDTIIHTIKSVKIGSSKSLTVLNNIAEVTIDGIKLDIDGYLDIGLYDTMKDLLNNLFGTVLFVLIWLGRKEKVNKYLFLHTNDHLNQKG